MATTDAPDAFDALDSVPGEESDLSSYRPSLVKLVDDIRDSEQQLFGGFRSRREILLWTQKLAVRTLGELPQEWFHKVGHQFQGVPSSERERTLVSALLVEDKRSRPIGRSQAREFRRQLSAQTIRPAAHRAFRQLRKDAGEYVGDGEDTQHAPSKQRYVAMRPAIEELNQTQRRSLKQLLAGLSNREAILEWGHSLELATHGEIDEGFVTRCYGEKSTRNVLTGIEKTDERARELFAARFLIPAFNRGIRDLSGRAQESIDAEITPTEAKTL